MATSHKPQPPIEQLTAQVIESYRSEPGTSHLEATFLPSRARVIEAIEVLRRIIFPGFFEEKRITSANVQQRTAELIQQLHDLLYEQIHQTLRYELNRTQGKGKGDECKNCGQQAADLTLAFLSTIPGLRHNLALDVQAAFEGDPASVSTDETIFCYPGVDAIFIYRAAHEMFRLEVPLLPRIMSEYAHNETGIDIHPGATIGESFFIDHGTGVVIGETTIIGDRVKIYQGVTLGALSTKGGQAWRGRKRHPTIEDDVTIYGGAIILGGETVIHEGATIGGSLFITHSVPAGHYVSMKDPELKLRPPKKNWRPRSQKKSIE
ncbi:MAG: serine acetyltransferase [Phycisphaeraceae bacterium]|nr:serine acetyltransferase [Phycisphaeraceae bacterium]